SRSPWVRRTCPTFRSKSGRERTPRELDGSVWRRFFEASLIIWGVVMSRLRDAVEQVVFARRYTLGILDTIDPADWFRMPAEGITHVAWQVGHLAMVQFRLGMERVRGPRPGDEDLMPAAFLKAFGRDSVADPDPAKYPPPAVIRTTFDRV